MAVCGSMSHSVAHSIPLILDVGQGGLHNWPHEVQVWQPYIVKFVFTDPEVACVFAAE
jgi:hypothetical protein